jgi:hypothetical protein
MRLRTRPGRSNGELLRDQAAQRESESVDLLNAEGVDEGGCVLRHLFNRSRNLATGIGDAGVVQQNHLPVRDNSPS